MSDSIIFLDSNVLLYAFGNDAQRKNAAKDLLRMKPIISTQVMNEVISILYRKFGFSDDEIKNIYDFMMSNMTIRVIDPASINRAIRLKEKYKYSYWDSLIIASALANECSILYSEDLQDGQNIENKLFIINPFKNL
jgi:predicted nucleic acid-binding protein